MLLIQHKNIVSISQLKVVNKAREENLNHVHIYLPKSMIRAPVQD